MGGGLQDGISSGMCTGLPAMQGISASWTSPGGERRILGVGGGQVILGQLLRKTRRAEPTSPLIATQHRCYSNRFFRHT